ncbi:peptidase M23-like protein [Anaerobacterium chartisolvens]|uniref:Peptidase M23-like protein n=1 Tax=Anaerobacterium chartisolvens TaxID=1297424 RepID=A0A369B9W9_9FIRM|nr:M23 family metallopeptidase [Anaerobacterium chartisolvens]RCX18329.1 peptidase M23-like protein [Anaerobacterium chartisolvens]
MRRGILWVLIISISLVWVLPVRADQLSDYNKQKNDVKSQLNSINGEKGKIKDSIQDKKKEKQYLENQQQNREKEYQKLKTEKEELEAVLTELERSYSECEQEYNNQRELLKTRIRVMYENSSTSYLQTLIESKSMTDFFERLELISAISKNDKLIVDNLENAKKDLDSKKKRKEEEKLLTLKKVREKQTAITQIKISRADTDKDIQKYEVALELLEKREDELQKRSKEINKQIEKLMSAGKYTGGVMKWPVPSSTTITSGYGNRLHPILKKYKVHTGIDIGAKSGASITAAANGTVIKAEWDTAYGNMLVIDHGGKIATLYGHCSKLLVGVGDKVETGQTIAKVGSTGWSTGPHLHFEVIKDGASTDPISYLKGK